MSTLEEKLAQTNDSLDTVTNSVGFVSPSPTTPLAYIDSAIGSDMLKGSLFRSTDPAGNVSFWHTPTSGDILTSSGILLSKDSRPHTRVTFADMASQGITDYTPGFLTDWEGKAGPHAKNLRLRHFPAFARLILDDPIAKLSIGMIGSSGADQVICRAVTILGMHWSSVDGSPRPPPLFLPVELPKDLSAITGMGK